MKVGTMFKEKSQQFACKWDSKTKCFLVVDLWHEKVEDSEADDDVPEEAITVIPETAFRAVVAEAERINKLPSSKNRVISATSESLPSESESDEGWRKLQLRLKAINTIEKIVSIDATETLGRR